MNYHIRPFQKVEGKVDREVEDEKKLKQGEVIILKGGGVGWGDHNEQDYAKTINGFENYTLSLMSFDSYI